MAILANFPVFKLGVILETEKSCVNLQAYLSDEAKFGIHIGLRMQKFSSEVYAYPSSSSDSAAIPVALGGRTV